MKHERKLKNVHLKLQNKYEFSTILMVRNRILFEGSLRNKQSVAIFDPY